MEKMGPYLSERQSGTVRDDYGDDGNAWDRGKTARTTKTIHWLANIRANI
jgi:hypothetical protein